jgi:hydroxymethylbilane synthase
VYRIGTRKSALAKVQSRHIQSCLEGLGLKCELVEIDSAGDTDRTTPLYEIEPASPGLFTKQLENALLKNEIDLAVHSLKDLPTQQPAELVIAAVSTREDAADCLIIRADNVAPAPLGLPHGAVVGTSSLRREALLLAERPDLVVTPIRGNVPTRLQKVRDGVVTATLLAEAGLNRLGYTAEKLTAEGLTKIALPSDRFVPAPGQGALALETRRTVPGDFAAALNTLNNRIAETETRIERRVLQGLHGGCTLPLGVRCRMAANGALSLSAFLGLSSGEPRKWMDFYRFEAADTSEELLVARTVGYFAEKQKQQEGSSK